MGESLKNFIERRLRSFHANENHKTNFKSREELERFWLTIDSRSADISYLHSRYYAHKESQSFFLKYRLLIKKIFKTHITDENSALFFDKRGHLRTRKENRFLHFLSSRFSIHDSTVKETLPHFFITLSLFVAAAAAGYGIVSIFSSYGEYFLPKQITDQLSQGILWTNVLEDKPVTGGSGIIINNIFVTLNAYFYGLLLGLPSVIIVLFNGWHLGSVFAATQKFDMHLSLLQFVSNHGILEISIILFAGALGLRTGLSFFTAPRGMKMSTIAVRFWESINSIFILCIWLFACGLVESLVSPFISKLKPHGLAVIIALSIGFSLFALNILVHHGAFYHARKRKKQSSN
jgi:uncharacterized membrane protein SpoIIM required for sporulation